MTVGVGVIVAVGVCVGVFPVGVTVGVGLIVFVGVMVGVQMMHVPVSPLPPEQTLALV